MNRVYLDYAASTPVRPEVLQAMEPYWQHSFANPHSSHEEGRMALRAIDEARDMIADLLGCTSREIIFTSGATESNLMAIQHAGPRAIRNELPHLATTQVEHRSIRDAAHILNQRNTLRLSWIPTDMQGRVSETLLRDFLEGHQDDTAPDVISIISTNNETGVENDYHRLSTVAQRHNVLFHTDASQLLLDHWTPLRETALSLMTLSGQKMGGPKGVGLLYVRKQTPIRALFPGGSQEFELRAGTPAVPLIVGFAEAMRLKMRDSEQLRSKWIRYREYLKRLLSDSRPDILFSFEEGSVHPGIISATIPGMNAEDILIKADALGVALSMGAACSSGSSDPSPVLIALRGREAAQSTIRMSFGTETTDEDIRVAGERLSRVLQNMA